MGSSTSRPTTVGYTPWMPRPVRPCGKPMMWGSNSTPGCGRTGHSRLLGRARALADRRACLELLGRKVSPHPQLTLYSSEPTTALLGMLADGGPSGVTKSVTKSTPPRRRPTAWFTWARTTTSFTPWTPRPGHSYGSFRQGTMWRGSSTTIRFTLVRLMETCMPSPPGSLKATSLHHLPLILQPLYPPLPMR